MCRPGKKCCSSGECTANYTPFNLHQTAHRKRHQTRTRDPPAHTPHLQFALGQLHVKAGLHEQVIPQHPLQQQLVAVPVHCATQWTQKSAKMGGGLRRITILTNFFTSHKVGLFAEQNAPKGSKINSFGNEGIGRTARSCGRGPVPTNRNDNLFLPNSNSLLKLKTQLTYITSTCIWFPKF